MRRDCWSSSTRVSKVLIVTPELVDAELSGEESVADGRTILMLQAGVAFCNVVPAVVAVAEVTAVTMDHVEERLDALMERSCEEALGLELARMSSEFDIIYAERRREATERSPPAPTLGEDSKAGAKKEAAWSWRGEFSRATMCSRACLSNV